MKDFIGGHEVVTASDLVELALGTPLELWLGEEGESDEERAAREDAARDIIADDPGMADRALRVAVEAIGEHMPALLRITPPVRSAGRKRRTSRSGVAA